MRRNGIPAYWPGSTSIPAGQGRQPVRLVVPFLGARMSLTYEVMRFVPDREVLLHAVNALLRSTDRIVVAGAADGSTVSYDAEVRLRGPLRVIDPSCGRVSASRRSGRLPGSPVPCPGARPVAIPGPQRPHRPGLSGRQSRREAGRDRLRAGGGRGPRDLRGPRLLPDRAQPNLLPPQQGADTIVWLAAMSPERLGSGRFWQTGARGPNTRCRGHASTTPAPSASSGTTRLAVATAAGVRRQSRRAGRRCRAPAG